MSAIINFIQNSYLFVSILSTLLGFGSTIVALTDKVKDNSNRLKKGVYIVSGLLLLVVGLGTFFSNVLYTKVPDVSLMSLDRARNVIGIDFVPHEKGEWENNYVSVLRQNPKGGEYARKRSDVILFVGSKPSDIELSVLNFYEDYILLSALINKDGEKPIEDYGFIYNGDRKSVKNSKELLLPLPYELNLTDLKDGVNYEIVAYAKNENGESISSPVYFTPRIPKEVAYYIDEVNYKTESYQSRDTVLSDDDLKVISIASNIKKIDINSKHISDISAFRGLSELEELILWGNDIIDISPLKELKQLKILDLRNNINIIDISPLKALRKLSEFEMNCNNCSDLGAINDLPLLWKLTLSTLDDVGLSTINFLNLKYLDYLELFSSRSPIDCNNIKAPVLKTLKLKICKIKNVNSLANIATLLYLDLSYGDLDDIDFLKTMSNLKTINLRGTKLNGSNITFDQIKGLINALPNTTITW